MAVMAREAWTDERLDDLNKKVDEGFKDMRAEFRSVRGEFQAVRAEMATQVAMLNQTMYRLFGGMSVTWVIGIVAILTQV
jgi:hypothetical protein